MHGLPEFFCTKIADPNEVLPNCKNEFNMYKNNLENVSKICEEIANTANVEFTKVQRRVVLVDMEKPRMLHNEL